MDAVHTLLMDHQIKPSYTRVKIFKYLQEHKNHPTVDEIYQALTEELPTLSKTTVYNTLKLYIDHHLVKELVLKEQKHYDLITTPHAHFKCDRCEQLFDIAIEPPALDETYEDAFEVRDAQLLYHGVCRSCQRSQA